MHLMSPLVYLGNTKAGGPAITVRLETRSDFAGLTIHKKRLKLVNQPLPTLLRNISSNFSGESLVNSLFIITSSGNSFES